MSIDKEFDQPLWKIFYYTKLNKQLEREVGDFLRRNTNSPKLYSNALRHQYGGALYGRNFSPDTARNLGNIAEAFDSGFSTRDDIAEDKKNNEIGIQYGIKYPNASKQQLLEIMFRNM